MPKTNRPKVVIFSQGDEVITGATVDTNAAYLADHCSALGFDIIRHITVADELDDLVQVLQDIDEQADICLCTGGLGPTQDDLTTEAFAKAFKTELIFDETALVMMKDYFAKLHVDMPALNRKQAYLPADSTRIDNHWGTAPGFVASGKNCLFYCMPGVPYEMKNMLETVVLDDLRTRFTVEKTTLVTLRTMGMGESAMQQEIDKLALADDVRISFRAGLPENELKLVFPHGANEGEMHATVNRVKEVLSDSVFAVDGLGQSIKSLPAYVSQLMQNKGYTLNVLETLSQGDIAQQCDSKYLIKSTVFPQVSGIMSSFALLGVSIDESLAIKIAKQEHASTAATLTLVQLYEETASNETQIFIVVVDGKRTLSASKTIQGRIERKRTIASAAALNLLRKYLLNS
ncbi:MAG: molybdenum cofactor biosynthesis protein [Cycloclasticus sp. symbiont of Bathymodiolus heckerae]|nr:MAG: molybdenum cofactor biosynthesis protein [Cycloclasticus sp. symbiont of Bathymodiolus heckerae]